MSYQVLARKWRPSTFDQMVGQEHVLKALVNALDSGRLHHAYLFTGTRGVGKTSIARLFAKSLNCEKGVSSTPCGECSPCREISEGRFVDLIEVDAASRTKVEDTRELLENVQYAPSQGRYKVYLIDEVHMLSTHSFNALLKTLEEPPPHIKFLLATTDPHKLPVTILSRCLQFNLKNMTPERVVAHLQQVLNAERVSFEEPALWLLSRAASGSMRDAMSLADQAISYGNGQLLETDVRAMLGSVDQQQVLELLRLLAEGSAQRVMDLVAGIAEYGADFDDVLAELLGLLHRVAIAQALPEGVDNSQGDREAVLALARTLKAEDVQLFYQIALAGRKDLPLVPVARDGFEMTLLRMLAFRPVLPGEQALPQAQADTSTSASAVASASAAADTKIQSQTDARQPDPPEPVASAAPVARASITSSRPLASAELRAEAPAPGGEDHPSTATVSPPAAPVASPPPMDDPPPWGDAGGQAAVVERTASAESVKTAESVSHESAESNESTESAAAPPSAVELEPPVPGRSVTPDRDPRPPKKPEAPEVAVAADTAGAPQRSDAALRPAAELTGAQLSNVQLSELDGKRWVALLDAIDLSGMTYNIAANATVESVTAEQVVFVLPARQIHLFNATHQQRIEEALSAYFGHPLKVRVNEGESAEETPAQFKHRRRQQRLAEAVALMQGDSNVQAISQQYGGVLDIGSVKPVGPE